MHTPMKIRWKCIRNAWNKLVKGKINMCLRVKDWQIINLIKKVKTGRGVFHNKEVFPASKSDMLTSKLVSSNTCKLVILSSYPTIGTIFGGITSFHGSNMIF